MTAVADLVLVMTTFLCGTTGTPVGDKASCALRLRKLPRLVKPISISAIVAAESWGISLVLGSQARIVLTGVFVCSRHRDRSVASGWPAPVDSRSANGALMSAMAGLVVLIGREECLSSAHTLWSDALILWATSLASEHGREYLHPRPSLPRVHPSLAAVHSLILQVGAELGAIGVVLLTLVFVGGLVFAAQGSLPVAPITMVA